MTQAKPQNASDLKHRIPTFIMAGGVSPIGHLRDDDYNGEIIHCSSRNLPDGRNY